VGIKVSFRVGDLVQDLSKQELGELSEGALDGDHVWYEYLTQEDDRVRPSHAALHGTRWRADDPSAPTPPTDYGCRCFIRYIAAPESLASKVLPEASGALSNRNDSFKLWLNDNTDGWKNIAKAAKQLRPVDRLEFIREELIDGGVASSLARDQAFMIMSVI